MSDTSGIPSRPGCGVRRRALPAAIRGVAMASAGVLLAQPLALRTALAGPTGGEVVAGQGRIQAPDAATTVVQQRSHSLAINWQTFDVAAGEQVQFNQPSSSSAVLNRVLNQSPSQIFGQVRANGQVFILNAGGVVIGRSARVDVGGLVVSSLDVKDHDFMQGRYVFEARDGETPGAIVNRGLIRAAAGGSVSLVGGQVSNEGVIVADMGHVTLAAGRTATLDFDGDGLIRFEVGDEVLSNPAGAAAAVSNAGEIHAAGGRVTLTARTASRVFDLAVNNAGLVRAGSIRRSGGKVLLTGVGGAVVNAGTVEASGSSGGDVALVSDVGVDQLGTVRADGAAGDGGRVRAASAGATRLGGDSVTSVRSAAAAGGAVEVLGAQVALDGGASVDASGGAGGGTVRVGGGLHGSAPGVANARTTAVAAQASIRADAGAAGDGGTVVVWADEITRFQGAISARGGRIAGDGGFVEVSGKERLVFAGAVDTRAAAGRTGTLLLDPKNIVIADGATDAVADNDSFAENAALDATFDADAVVAALGTSSLILQANNDILITEDIVGPANGNSLTLQAGRHIVLARTPLLAGDQVDAAATDAGGGVSVTLNGGGFTAVVDDPGAVTDRDGGNAEFFMAAGSGIATRGGAVSVTAGGGTGDVGGFVLTAVTTDAAAAGADQPGGNAGAVVVTGPAAVSVGAVSARGGAGSDAMDDGVARAGGAGGAVTLTSAAATLTVAGIDTRGGAASVVNAGDAAGGAGGDVTLDTGGGIIRLGAGTVDSGGGTGVNGGARGDGGAVAVGDPAALTGGALTVDTGPSGGAIAFSGTLDSAAGETNGLVLAAGTGAVSFAAPVGGSDPLGVVTVNSAGDLTIGDSFAAAGFTQLAGTGTTGIAGAMTVTGDVSIAAAIIDLGAAIDAAGQTVTLAATDSILDGNGGAVNVTAAAADLSAAGGGIALGTTLETAVASLIAAGATGVDIHNTGPVTATLNASGGAVAFSNLAGGVTSAGPWTAAALDVGAGGTLALDHAVTVSGGTLRLATSAGDVVLDAPLAASGHDVVLDAAGAVSGGAGATITTSASVADGAAGAVTVDGAAGVSLAGAIAAVGDGAGAGGAVDIDAAAGGVSVASIDASGGVGASTGGAIALNTAGTGGVTLGGSLASTGGASGGTIHVGDALSLTADALLSTGAAGGAITLDGDVQGGRVLTLTTGGDLDLSAIAVGPAAAELQAFEITHAGQVSLGAVRVTGGLAADPGVGIRVQADTSILLNGPLTTSGGAGGELLIVGGGVDQNGQSITLGAGDIVLGAAGGDVTISLDDVRAQTITVLANRDIFVDALVDATGGMTPGAFDVVLTADFDGDGAGGVQVRPGGRVRADRNVTITGSDLFATALAGDAVVIDADLANEPRVAAGGDVTLRTSASAPAGADIVVSGPVASTGGGLVLLDADDAGGEIRLSADLDATGGGLRFADALVLAGGGRGLAADLVQFDGTVDGGGNDLTVTGMAGFGAPVAGVANLVVTGAVTVAADVAATGTQSWQSPLTLTGGDPVFTGTTVSFDGGVTGGGNDLTVSGDAALGAAVSGVADLVVTGASAIGADVTTTGTQGWQGPVTLSGGARTLTGTTVSFGDTLAGGGNALTVTGNAGFDGAVSAVSALDVSGLAAIGADVATTLTQTWRGAVTLAGGDPELSATTVSFEGPVTGGGNDLTVTGMAGFGAPVAGVANLVVTGAATVAADVAATGTQSWQSSLTLTGGDPVFTGTTVSFDGGVTGGGNDLTVSGDAALGAAVSGVADLVVTGASAIGADVTTTGTQGWQGPVTLSGGARTLTGTTVSFGDTLAGGGDALTVTGNAGFDGAVSAVTALDVSGLAAIGADVATTLTQTWRGAVTLAGGDPELSATTVSFEGPVTGGGNDLTVTGMAGFGAPVAGVANLVVTGAATVAADVAATGTQSWQSSLTLTGGDPVFTGTTVSFDGGVTGGGNDLTVSGDAALGAAVSGVADLVVTGASAIGADVTTTGTQGWQGPVTLSGGARTLTGTTVSFGDTLAGGGNALTVTGNAGFDGAVSAVTVLDVSGLAAIGADVATTLTQTWRGAVTLAGGDHTLSGSALDFQAPAGTGGNDVTLLFDDVAIGAALNAGTGIVTVDTTTPRAIDLGTQTAGELSLTLAELAAISAGTLRIGRAAGAVNSGITVSDALAPMSPVLALRTTGAVDGAGGVDGGALGIAAGAGVTLDGANDVAALGIAAGGDVSFNDTSGFTIATVDGIAGLAAPGATVTIVAAGDVGQDPVMDAGATVVAGTLDVELTGAATLELLNGGNDVDDLIADVGGSVSFRDVDDLTVPGAEEISADGSVALEAGTLLTLAGDVEADSVTLVSGTDLSAPGGVITTDAAGTLAVTSGGIAALDATAHAVSRLTGSSMGALGFTSSSSLFIQAFDTHGAAATVTTTAGNIAGGTLTASSVVLNAAGEIGGIDVDTTDRSGPMPVLGALSLASAGDAAAGNITVTDVSGIARDTSTVTVLTTGAGAQVVTLRNDAGFGYDADPVAAAPPTFLTLDGDTVLRADATVGASSRLTFQGRTVLAGGARTVGGGGNVVFDGAVVGNGHDLTVNANGAAFTGNVTVGGGATLALDSPTTLFTGTTDLVADNLLLGGGPGSIAGAGSLTILRATPSALDTTLGGADPLFRAANLAALDGFGGTLGIGGTRTVTPTVGQVLNDIVVDGALSTAGDVFLVGAGDVTFDSASGSISTPGTVTVLALGSASATGSGNIRDTDAGLSAGPTPKVIDAGTVELLASNQIGSESALEGATLNVRAATLSAAQGLAGEAQVDRVGGSAETDSVLDVLGIYAAAASGPGPLVGIFNDAFLGIGSTSSISTVSISTPKQAKGELGFIDEGVFLLPPTFTSPERALLLPLLGDPDFPGDQRPENPDDDAAWRSFFDDVVRPFIESRYPLAEGAGDGERAAVEALVAAELRAVIAFYDRVRDRERAMLAREEAEREERAVPQESDQAPAGEDGESASGALPAAADAHAPAATTRAGTRLGHVGRRWRDGGIGVEPRGWHGSGGGWPVGVMPRS